MGKNIPMTDEREARRANFATVEAKSSLSYVAFGIAMIAAFAIGFMI